MLRFLLGLLLAGVASWAVWHGTGDPALAIFAMCMVALSVWFSVFRCHCAACTEARG